MKTLLYIGHKATKEQVEQLNTSIKGEIVKVFVDGDIYGIIGDDKAKDNFLILKSEVDGRFPNNQI